MYFEIFTFEGSYGHAHWLSFSDFSLVKTIVDSDSILGTYRWDASPGHYEHTHSHVFTHREKFSKSSHPQVTCIFGRLGRNLCKHERVCKTVHRQLPKLRIRLIWRWYSCILNVGKNISTTLFFFFFFFTECECSYILYCSCESFSSGALMGFMGKR